MPYHSKIAYELLNMYVGSDKLMLMRFSAGPNMGSLGLGIEEVDGESAAIILPKEAALALASAIAAEFGYVVLSRN